MRAAATLIALILALTFAACGGGDDDSGEEDDAAEVAAPADSGESADVDGKPPVEVPDGPPPEELEITDIVEGDGEEAQEGDVVQVHYVGVAYSNGEEFDASWDRNQEFAFQLGAGQVIQGWDEGLVGMREGGRRQLVIPPDMAYGEGGSGPIGPNETLIFVVDLIAIG